MLISIVPEVINLIIVGHLGDSHKLAGVGLGNMAVNLLAYSSVIGLNEALQTLVSLAYRADNLYMCGLYLNRARLIATLIFIPIACALFYIESILTFMQLNHEVAAYAATYVRIAIPGIYF